ncbi:G-type lectin S-receptor-like serine/threonine-protein kinase At1g11300 [Magnolia sinica]|uniref:G-type lectin S-receptor-like serine/threonine-protein kinase At1g11300 n=1 Tax=Magnolia sinica TaxID=86752 RepID=UPI00265A0B14|nr:G-type lectin S-receptor-like serine/threonine-protein kinase At1g11300 [Magnolia sinica]
MVTATSKRNVRALLLSLSLFLIFMLHFCTAIDTITPTQFIKEGQSLISTGEIYQLGFFSPPNSKNRYVGTWFHNVPTQTVVWVANRENPLTDSSGVFRINGDGNLAVVDGRGNILWSSNSSTAVKNSTATILDTGNLVLRERNSSSSNGVVIWESFKDLSDSFLPTMELYVNLKTGERNVLTSWKSSNDPAVGNFTFGIDGHEIPQLLVWNGKNRYWRSGQWNGKIFTGRPLMYDNYLNGPRVVNIQEGMIYYTHAYFSKGYSRLWLEWDGMFTQKNWDENRKEWFVPWQDPRTQCDVYGTCGPFGVCREFGSQMCSCLRGFEPKSIDEWNKGSWSGGCVRRTQLNCSSDGFLKLEKMKMPDFSDWMRLLNAKECEDGCLKNCSCVAYAHVSGIGCMVWGGDLMDIQEFPSSGEDLHIRLAISELREKGDSKLIIRRTLVALAITILGFCTCILGWWLVKQRGKKTRMQAMTLFEASSRVIEGSRSSSEADTLRNGIKQVNGLELPIFEFRTIAFATNSFSNANKVGEGGFGPVYKGMLPEGQEVAVKRLSKSSGQGLQEFKNEVILISKLQHRNLVKLLGCCIEGEEKLLVYEYMPNKGLDSFLFDPKQKAVLAWGRRFHIVEGIARGLLYLHRDSRLKIIHRDLKASNILLDGSLNPKISDFGTARIFGGDQILARTNRVVGTYGYMSPEYAMQGRFSEKSDVFSFGILLLEIVSGMRNMGFYPRTGSWSLSDYAWRLWNEDTMLEMIDPVLVGSVSKSEVLRCLHVGLLCVQEFEADRPTMASVVFMLGSEIVTLPTPKPPAFTISRNSAKSDSAQNHGIFTVNEVTMTTIHGR